MASRKSINTYIPKYFIAVRKCTNHYIPNYLCTSRGSLYGLAAWNEPTIHFVTVQLVTSIENLLFFCALLEFPIMIWKRSRPSP